MLPAGVHPQAVLLDIKRNTPAKPAKPAKGSRKAKAAGQPDGEEGAAGARHVLVSSAHGTAAEVCYSVLPYRHVHGVLSCSQDTSCPGALQPSPSVSVQASSRQQELQQGMSTLAP
jgi:hypothetical protein